MAEQYFKITYPGAADTLFSDRDFLTNQVEPLINRAAATGWGVTSNASGVTLRFGGPTAHAIASAFKAALDTVVGRSGTLTILATNANFMETGVDARARRGGR